MSAAWERKKACPFLTVTGALKLVLCQPGVVVTDIVPFAAAVRLGLPTLSAR